MADETVAKLAKEQKTTRAAVSMEIAASWNKPNHICGRKCTDGADEAL